MLSIIVPVRNESDALKEMLNYFSQNLPNLNYEVLIVNDFSDDDTLKKAETLIAKNSRFKVFDNKKKGLG
jgi:glycosyltransferase involved in cell wall biosynthesis